MQFESTDPSVVRSVKQRDLLNAWLQAIGIEGRFKITNLTAIKPKTTPVNVIKAVIDLDFVRAPMARGISDDIIEID